MDNLRLQGPRRPTRRRLPKLAAYPETPDCASASTGTLARSAGGACAFWSAPQSKYQGNRSPREATDNPDASKASIRISRIMLAYSRFHVVTHSFQFFWDREGSSQATFLKELSPSNHVCSWNSVMAIRTSLLAMGNKAL